MPEPISLHPRETDPRDPSKLQCTACGCGYMVGLDPDAMRYAKEVIAKGYGLRLVPDCPGCGCHTGVGILPHIRVTYPLIER